MLTARAVCAALNEKKNLATKVRVYELARELGISNAETLELCGALGIGAKCHSSSIVDAQADRVRRKAEREGLVREVPPEPEKPEAASYTHLTLPTTPYV